MRPVKVDKRARMGYNLKERRKEECVMLKAEEYQLKLKELRDTLNEAGNSL